LTDTTNYRQKKITGAQSFNFALKFSQNVSFQALNYNFCTQIFQQEKVGNASVFILNFRALYKFVFLALLFILSVFITDILVPSVLFSIIIIVINAKRRND